MTVFKNSLLNFHKNGHFELHTCNKSSVTSSKCSKTSGTFQKLLLLEDFFSHSPFLQNYQNTRTTKRAPFFMWVEICSAHSANTGSSPKSLAPINTEVKRRTLSFRDKSPSFSEWLSPCKASGWLLPVVCDGLPKFTQDPSSQS